MKTRSFSAQLVYGLLLAAATLGLGACLGPIYYHTEYTFSGRPIPPSGFTNRVLASYTANGSSGGLEILDAYRDLRRNVQNTVQTYSISGFSAADPVTIYNFPEQTSGYVLSYTDGGFIKVNYSTEASSGSVGISFGADPPSAGVDPNGDTIAGASESAGILYLQANGTSYGFSLPNIDRVFVNTGGSIVLAMVRNTTPGTCSAPTTAGALSPCSHTIYRIVKLPLPANPSTLTLPPGYVDCEPLLAPVYCVVPVGDLNPAGVAVPMFDQPQGAYFSLDGNSVDILNCGPECGGTQASVTVLSAAALNINNIPTVNPFSPGAPSPLLASLPVANPVPVPGGVTTALSDGTTLYMAGQSVQTGGLFGGNLSLMNLTSYTVGTPIPISDGTHTRMLFADDNTMWIGSSQCASGIRAYTASQELASKGYTDQAGNYNCLTMVTLGTSTPAAPPVQIIPAVVQSSSSSVAAVPVSYPNTNQNQYYYGSLTGICWVQGLHKVYSAYGGQIHGFYTGGTINDGTIYAGTTPAAGTELDNTNITVQGTVLDVAYMDAETNSAN